MSLHQMPPMFPKLDTSRMYKTAGGVWVSPGAELLMMYPSDIRALWPLTIEKIRQAPVPFGVDRCDVGCLNEEVLVELRQEMIVNLQAEILEHKPAKYTEPAQGEPALRYEVASWVNRLCGHPDMIGTNQVLVIDAGLGGVEKAVEQFSLDWAARVTPGWGNSVKAIIRKGRRLIELYCEDGHLPSAEEMAEALPDTPGMLLIDDPNNPLGESSTEQDVKCIERLLELKPNLTVVLDHEYLGFNSGPFYSAFSLRHPRVIGFTSLSKIGGLGHYRLGFMFWHRNAGLDDHMAALGDYYLSQNNAGGIQLAVAHNMANGKLFGEFERIVAEVDGRRAVTKEEFAGCEVAEVFPGNSAFYMTVGRKAGGPQWDAAKVRIYGIQQRYEGDPRFVGREFTDACQAFNMRGARVRFTLAPTKMRRAARNYRLDLEYYCEDRCPDVPTAHEMVRRYSPDEMVKRGLLLKTSTGYALPIFNGDPRPGVSEPVLEA